MFEPLEVAPIVYLHNQYYNDGKLFPREDRDYIPKAIDDLRHYYQFYKDRKTGNQFGGALYTRNKCNNLIKTIHAFFKKTGEGFDNQYRFETDRYKKYIKSKS